MSLFVIRYDYDTIIAKNRDYRYDFDFFKRNNHLNWAVVQQYQPWERRGRGGGRAGGLDGGG